MAALITRLLLFIFFKHYHLISDDQLWNNYLFLYLPNQLPVFAFGIVLYFLIYGSNGAELSPKFLFFYAIIVLLGICISQDFVLIEIDYFAIFFMCLCYALHRYHPKILFNGFVRYTGKISYTLYLTHWASIHFLTKYNMVNFIRSHNSSSALANFLINYLMVFLLSMLLSTILYHAIEAPMQIIGAKIIDRLNRGNAKSSESLMG